MYMRTYCDALLRCHAESLAPKGGTGSYMTTTIHRGAVPRRAIPFKHNCHRDFCGGNEWKTMAYVFLLDEERVRPMSGV